MPPDYSAQYKMATLQFVEAMDRRIAQFKLRPSKHRNAKRTACRAAFFGTSRDDVRHNPDPRRFDAPVPSHPIPNRPVRRMVAHSSGGKPG